MSLWGGWGQGTSGGPNSSPEEELARRWRQEKEEEVLAILSGVVEPCTGKDVVELGFVQDVRIDGEPSLQEQKTLVNSKTYLCVSHDLWPSLTAVALCKLTLLAWFCYDTNLVLGTTLQIEAPRV